jgi:hypothetical protein
MKKPVPEIGQIIKYDYLWRDESDRERIEGAKERPCAVVLATEQTDTGSVHVYVAPITHSAPKLGQRAIEIPVQATKMTGLDEARSWLVTSEVNRVDWLDAGIVTVKNGQWLYGHLPRGIAKQAVRQVVDHWRSRTLRMVDRTKAISLNHARDDDNGY